MKKIDLSKMTPERYQRVLELRRRINAMKKEIALSRFEDYYNDETDNDDYNNMEKKLQVLSNELTNYEF